MERLQYRKKILLIVEGEKAEPRFFHQLFLTYGLDFDIFVVGTNIYLLYEELKNYDFECDVKDVLAEMTVSKGDKELTAHFTDETDPAIGKLYVNYPMMESYRDSDDFFSDQYRTNSVSIDDMSRYKEIAGKRRLSNVRLDKYTKENFKSLSKMNLFKLNEISRGIWDWPEYEEYLHLSEQSQILQHEIKIVNENRTISVLNTSLLLLFDYFGNRDGFYDNYEKE
ncbi:MAG: hypothetical protein ACI4LN_01560 [Anaerovoracaceae bacterium]